MDRRSTGGATSCQRGCKLAASARMPDEHVHGGRWPARGATPSRVCVLRSLRGVMIRNEVNNNEHRTYQQRCITLSIHN
eukprot:6214740-Pleurochrysis_carterae.AAC.3